MSSIPNARRLRRSMTDEEKSLWKSLRAGRFAGFKFRRQHPIGKYTLDFYCPAAKLCVELDGSQHGFPKQRQKDEERSQFLATRGITEMRYWNHQWRNNQSGVMLEIWHTLHQRTGCVAVVRKVQNRRFAPPDPDDLIPPPLKPKLQPK